MVELVTHETLNGMRLQRGPMDPRVTLGLVVATPKVDRLRTRWLRRFATLAVRRSPVWSGGPDSPKG